jgi:DNA-binding LacI/PurR family transcriptional regulator
VTTAATRAAEVGEVVGRVTLQTIADRVGVSRMTVSNAFSRPDQLSPAMRERILAAAEDLGYVGPDPTARALARGSAGAIGVLLTDSLRHAFTDEVATGFLGAVADELAPTGLALTLLTAASGLVIPARDVALDGAIVYSCVPDSQALQWLRRRRLPLVYVDQDPVDGSPSVNIDDFPGARAAARHLVELGHRRIAIVSTSMVGPYGLVCDPAAARELYGHSNHVVHQRLEGWLDELETAGISPQVVVEPPVTAGTRGTAPDTGSAALLLELPEPPTAVLCFSDVIAHGVVQAARARGLRVPEDLSVVGFDDAPLASRLSPGLTTVRQDVDAKGRAAAAALTAVLAPAGAVQRIILTTELIVRGSTAAPPRNG